MKSILIDGIEYKFAFEPHGGGYADTVGDIWRGIYKEFYMEEAMKLLTSEQKAFLKNVATELVNEKREKMVTEKQAILVYQRPSFG